MNTIKDILKDNVVQMGLLENISLPYLLLVMGTALICALVIYAVYRFFYKGAVYSENFGLLIIMSTLTVAFIIVTISSNIVLSLGMVGALSIVRFRTAVKDPLDVGFLFLAIASGLTAGAGLFFVAILGTVGICIVYIVMAVLGRGRNAYMLVVRYKVETEQDVQQVMETFKKRLKSKNSDGEIVEAVYSVKMRDESAVERLARVNGVEKAFLVMYTGDGQY